MDWDWKKVLMMYDDMHKLKRMKPELRLEKYYLIFVYNLLEMNRIVEAEAIFDEIPSDYFKGEVDLDLDEAFNCGQEALRLRNKLKDRFLMLPERMELEQDLQDMQQRSELFIVITNFCDMATKSNEITASKKIDLLKNSISGKSYTLKLRAGMKKPLDQ